MNITTLRIMTILILSWGAMSAQEITGVTGPQSNCQCDTLQIDFNVTQAFTAGNQFSVELSNSSGVFSGNTIEVAPLSASAVGNYSIQAYIPCATPIGTGYEIRVLGNNPLTISDTLTNVSVGAVTSSVAHTADPAIVVHTSDSISVCTGTTVILNGPIATAPESYTYQWIKDTVNPWVANPSYIALPQDVNQTLSVGSSGRYKLVATSVLGGCSDTSAAYNVWVDTIPSTTNQAVAWPGMGAPSLSMLPGDSLLLSAEDTVAGWTYQWEIQNPHTSGTWSIIPGETDAWLIVKNTILPAGDTANFRVVVNNGTCDFTTNSLQVDYGLTPVDNIQNVNTSTQNCQCDTITVLFDVVVPLNPGNEFKVEMSTPAGAFPGQFIEITPLLGFGVGSYQMDAVIPCSTPQGVFSIRVVSTDPITTSQPVTNVIVGALPNTEITIYNTYTYGQEQRFCDGDTAILVGPEPPVGETHQYQWFSGGSPIAGETNDTLVVTSSGAYSVSVTRGLCEAMSNDTIVNAYTPPASIFHSPDPAIKIISNAGADSIQMCEGIIATLNAPIAFPPDVYEYQWFIDTLDSFGNPVKWPLPADTNQTLTTDSAGVYYVMVTAFPGGCMDTSDAFSVFVDTIPTTTIIALSTTNLCYEDTVVLAAMDSVAYPDWKYEWQAEYPAGSGMWIPSPNDTLPWIDIDTNKVPNADTIKFRLRTYNLTCEFFTNEETIIFFPDPVFTFFPSDSVAICVEDSIFVSCQGNALSYTWENGELDPGIWVYPTDAPTLWVEATGVNGCKSYDTLKIGVFQSTATITPPTVEVAPGEYAQFKGSGGTNFYWSTDLPADFNDRLDSVVSILPTADTTEVYLEVTGQFGCIDYDTAYIYIVLPEPGDDDRFQDVQNVITPNGDGRNDVLDLTNLLQGDDCSISILDRWGREIFQQDSYISSWNGTTTAGEELPDGTYYYIIKCDDEIRYKSAVTIIRNENK